jgi:hypothetical protein
MIVCKSAALAFPTKGSHKKNTTAKRNIRLLFIGITPYSWKFL